MESGLKVEPKNILVFRIGHLGDTLVALPAFWALRKRFPDAHLTLLTNVSVKHSDYLTAGSVLPSEGLFDDIITYPNETSKLRSLFSLFKLRSTIKRMKTDTLVYLMTRNRNEGRVTRDLNFFRMGGIGQHIGTKYLIENFLPQHGASPLSEVEAEYQYLLKCLSTEVAGIDPDRDVCTDLQLTAGEKQAGENWLREKCSEAFTEDRLVAIGPGSKWESKLWPEQNYNEVVSRLITERNVWPIIFGGDEDKEKGDRMIEIAGVGANAAGRLNIRQAAAALEHCRLYLGNDTGTMHLAATVGTPIVAVFAAIDYPGRWFPLGKHNIVIRKSVPCEGCHSPHCRFAHECLDISTDSVFGACAAMLDNKNAGR